MKKIDKYFLVFISLFYSGVTTGQNELKQVPIEEINGYIETSYNIIELIKKDDLLGVWSFNYYKNQDTLNLRGLIKNANELLVKYGTPSKDKIILEYFNNTAINREYVDVVFILNQYEKDTDEISFSFARDIGQSYIVSLTAHIKSDYDDFLKFIEEFEGENTK